MPVSWEIRGPVLIVTVVEDWSGGGPASAITEGMADPRFEPGTALLLDVRQSRMNPSASQISLRTDWMGYLRDKGLSSRCAIVVGPMAYQFGLARMAKSYLGFQDMELRIFNDRDEAFNWLSKREGAATAL